MNRITEHKASYALAALSTNCTGAARSTAAWIQFPQLASGKIVILTLMNLYQRWPFFKMGL